MQPFKSEVEFLQWKETNQWLWDLLDKYQLQLSRQLQAQGQSMLVCKDEELADTRHRAAKVHGGAETLQQLKDLNYEMIEEVFK